ncbi:family 10 glycosylhydrolase [Clostridium aminobutyricum]|uniref:Family 10 glycosylhydrolase n=1 Tax=Clostridium aminobutyricum TaxID=33953 RepID=A0A939D6X3_CLOAM|nr:family 10 glycosylhydrolase [Clostridium aminobutyricum]MBN7772191.1 family 10 glycosylhydrolase [Clostridium aminobutyricum]
MNKKESFKICSKVIVGMVAFLVVAAMCIAPWGQEPVFAASDLGVTIDGEAVVFQSGYGEPFIDSNSRTLVPFRVVMEAFGASVSWDNDNRTASVVKDETTVQVPIGQEYILVNGESVLNDTVAVIKDERTYLPIRAVLQAFGAGVSWDDANRTVVVRTDGTVNEGVPESDQGEIISRSGELDAMWISYLEYMEMPKDEAGFKAAIDTMFDRCVDLGMNAVIVHVRSHCDAMYPSQYYPWSNFVSGTQGVDPGYDPLKYMISAAHNRGLEFHAWLNPYRVTGYGCYWKQVAASNPAKVWLSDNDPSNDRWVLLHKGEYYLNPSVPQVRQMVADGVKEIVSNYDVDGIHFDDYFYPSVNDKDSSLYFDKPEYDASGSTLSIADWRRNNVNKMVQDVYTVVKAINPDVEFGISPAGNVDNLRRNDANFVDIDTWLSHSGYVDYIMPQLYWGFERRDASGNIAAYAYENNLNTWINLAAKGNAKLYIGLNMANAGCNVSDNNSVSEWLCYDDIIARQVLTARATGEVDGFAFFRYAIFNKSEAQKEVANLKQKL